MAFGDLCGCKIHYKNIIYLISFCEVRLHFPPVFHEQFTLFKDKKRRLGILFFLRFKTGIYTLSTMKTFSTYSKFNLFTIF